jgi:hypothetical protein
METISILPPELIRMVIAAVIIISFLFLNAIMMGYESQDTFNGVPVPWKWGRTASFKWLSME